MSSLTTGVFQLKRLVNQLPFGADAASRAGLGDANKGETVGDVFFDLRLSLLAVVTPGSKAEMLAGCGETPAIAKPKVTFFLS